MSKQVKIVPDDLILCINDFKRSLNGQTINVMGKDYATVALRLAVARRNLGARLNIATEVMHNDKETCVVKATVSINDKIVATGLAETQKEKLASLAEGVEFETEEDFRKKVETIKESYFTKKAEVVAEAKTEPTEESSEPLVEETTSSTMSKYVDALARWSK